MTVSSNALAHRILEIIPLIMSTAAAQFRRTGHDLSPSHFGVLGYLSIVKVCNLTELAEKQAVSLPTMSNTVTHLAKRGWVQRTKSPQDRRKVLIELTPDGRIALDDMKEQIASRLAVLLTDLSHSNRESLLAGLAVLQNTFSQVSQTE